MADTEKKWYVLRAVSGKEAKVKEYIDAQLRLNEKRGSSRPRTVASREGRGTANKNGELFAESGSILQRTRYICAISPQFIAPCRDTARQSREHRGAARRGVPLGTLPECPTLGHSAEKAER